MTYNSNRVLVVVTRDEATKNGRTRYFTGRPCKKGHISERYTSTMGCVECLRPRKVVHSPFKLGVISYSPRLWCNEALTLEQLQGMDGYLQTCVDAYHMHLGLEKPGGRDP